MVAAVAKALQELSSKMVFVGGAVISLYTDDPAADEVRPTADIDMAIQLTGYSEWVEVQQRFKELGFIPDPQGHSICSYLYKNISVDIMPSEDGPIGIANSWYKPGFAFLQEVFVENEKIKILSAPYFLATKFEAFHSRSGGYRTSYDFEDIIYVIDNRMTIVEEVRNADDILRSFLKEEFKKLINNPYSEEIIRTQIHPLIVDERYPIIFDKINKIIS
jgi:predicted nucleotidyltransferase